MNVVAKTTGRTRPNAALPLLESTELLMLPVASGVMLALAFSPGNLQFLAWVALVPLGLALRRKGKLLELYLGLYLGGLAFHLIHLDWIRSGSEDSWLSGPRVTQWLAQGTILALLWPLLIAVARRFVSRAQPPMTVALPVVWVAFEFARKLLWGIFDATGYPYGQLGLTQTDQVRLIQVADMGGVYAVTAVVAAVNGLLIDVINWLLALCVRLPVRRPHLELAGVSSILTACLLYGSWRISQEIPRNGPVVCLMPLGRSSPSDVDEPGQGEVDQRLASANAIRYLRETNGQSVHPDLLIWSEGAYRGRIGPSRDGRSASTVEQFERFSRLVNASLVVGCDRVESAPNSTYYNSAFVVDQQRGNLGVYDKVFLVPFTEFHPPGRPTFGPAMRNPFAHGRAYPTFIVEGDEPRREFTFAVTICYDTAFPEAYHQYMRPSDRHVPDFFVVPASEAHDHQMRLQRALLALAQFRAIECRRAFVRNAEAGYSGIIDGNGRMIAQPEQIMFEMPAVLGRMPIDQRFSIYAITGDWLPVVACTAIFTVISSAGSLGRKLLFRLGGRRSPPRLASR